mmetsp:Transcript_10543/g.22337  ORF Transcript_10543/g.22337 Transcript_10543/m.22337 type:complete len:315 (+) Transcript_10543:85-1029(+)
MNMKLRIFRSTKHHVAPVVNSLPNIPSRSSSIYYEPSSTILPTSESATTLTSTSPWIIQHHTQNNNVTDSANVLENLSRLPKHQLPEFIIFHHNNPSTAAQQQQQQQHASSSSSSPTTTIESSLAYLREMLPLGAQFLEDHPTVGSACRRKNAHGKLLNDHVLGICHLFPHHSIAELAVILDVFLPTRLAISPRHRQTPLSKGDGGDDTTDNGGIVIDHPPSSSSDGTIRRTIEDDDWDAVVNNVDVVMAEEEEGGRNANSDSDRSSFRDFDELARHVWEAQRRDGAQCAFAVCGTSVEAERFEWLFLENHASS